MCLAFSLFPKAVFRYGTGRCLGVRVRREGPGVVGDDGREEARVS